MQIACQKLLNLKALLPFVSSIDEVFIMMVLEMFDTVNVSSLHCHTDHF